MARALYLSIIDGFHYDTDDGYREEDEEAVEESEEPEEREIDRHSDGHEGIID